VELLLTAIWNMFTEHQARRVVVAVPWDESDEPAQMALSKLAELLESWLE
jgi:RNase H-fold protein (predicted Holliday junction resolvase)